MKIRVLKGKMAAHRDTRFIHTFAHLPILSFILSSIFLSLPLSSFILLFILFLQPVTKRTEYILEWNLENLSVWFFLVPFSLKGSSKCTNHVNVHKLYAVEYINTVCSLNYPFQFRIKNIIWIMKPAYFIIWFSFNINFRFSIKWCSRAQKVI